MISIKSLVVRSLFVTVGATGFLLANSVIPKAAPTPQDVEKQPILLVTDLQAPDYQFTGQLVTVVATIKNIGASSEQPADVRLMVDGSEMATQEVKFQAGETASVTFTFFFIDRGWYPLEVTTDSSSRQAFVLIQDECDFVEAGAEYAECE